MATAPDTKTFPFVDPDDMPDLYAVKGVGTCMEPTFMDGASLAFDKRPSPKPGDIVGLIFTRDAAQRRRMPGVVKRLVVDLPAPGFDRLIVVEQLNPPRTYIFASSDVLAVHKFIGVAQRAENGRAFVRLPKGEE